MTRDRALAMKRLLDVTLAGIAMVPCLPLMAAIALAIKLESRGPVLFRQERAGLRGAPFVISKFRTLRTGADGDGPIYSMDDPRVTRVGRFLRRTSLDELPQLFNVVRGEMSLVGPRPQLIGTTRPHEMRRLEMPPGMTGLVEVSRPERMSWDERMATDVAYVDHWSLWLDVSIILRTVPVMFVRKNALDPPRAAGDARP
jgi:lipopolysaccharide/colanic/teichoic acid biosynthesis glycosyltransferase